MNIVIISKSFIVKEAISGLFENTFDNCSINIYDDIKNIDSNRVSLYDLIFIDSNEVNLEQIKFAINLKKYSEGLYVMVLDLLKDPKLCTNSIKMDVDGYITELQDKEEFRYIISKVISGKKFYDADMIKNTFKNQMKRISFNLTSREEEVMVHVSKGLSNKEIAEKLAVTEYTVKKHITSIFTKLKLKNRQDIIIYYKDKYKDIS